MNSSFGGANPSVAAGAGLGSAGTVSVSTGSDDTRGQITFTPGGTGILAGQMVTLAYAAMYATALYVFIQALDDAGPSLGYSVGDHGPSGFAIYTQNAPVSGTPYSVWY